MLRMLVGLLFAFLPVALAAEVDEREIAGHRVVIVTPKGLSGASEPLLIALHGGGGNIDHFRRNTGLEEVAEALHFRIAFVEGTAIGSGRRGFTWNAGACCGPAARHGTDDAGALAEVISVLTATRPDHPVMIFGHSNGAMMAYRMACEYAGLVDGIIAVSGALTLSDCGNAAGVSVLHIHGSRDKSVPMEGGRGPNSVTRTEFASTRQTLAALEAAGASVELLVLKDAGHTLRSLDEISRAQEGQRIAEIAGNMLLGQ